MKTEQVKFSNKNAGKDKFFGGIMVDNDIIICGCCGIVFKVSDIGKENIFPLSWVNISDEILGIIK